MYLWRALANLTEAPPFQERFVVSDFYVRQWESGMAALEVALARLASRHQGRSCWVTVRISRLSSQQEGHAWLMDHRRPQVSPGGLALLYPLSEPPLLPLQKLGI